ncbi:MAG: hypothetical protein J6C64_03740 [Lachnospiraceae bacterium]|nr:hypothetical protein [Lachnospiraceae bacterium]
MERLFQTHKVRKTTELDGIWQFYMAEHPEDIRQVLIPSCLETYPGLENYAGRYTYRRDVTVECDGTVRLVFKGVGHTADIYWDEKKVGCHYNAFTPFALVLEDVAAGVHSIRVEGDNSVHKDSALHVANDYYNYGGIIRPVILEELRPVYIEQVHFIPEFCQDIWNAHIKVFFHNLDCQAKIRLCISLDGEQVLSGEYTINPGKSHIEETVQVKDAQAYEPDAPRLYTMTAMLYAEGQCIDDLTDRVGFRTVSIEGKDILMNGKKLQIKGFNRHEDHGIFGCAMPVEAMDYDLRLFKDMGANAVRTSHYPNDERFLDLCDEYGILVWEESHARGLSEEQMRHPNFRKQSLCCIDEMLFSHINHPAIFTWGILNECASNTEYGREIYTEQLNRIRSWDTSRPLTFASCMIKSDICLDLPDIVSLNIYPLWYHDAEPEEYLKEVYHWIQETPGNGKPFLVSEIGAGAIPGYITHNDVRWSENRQAEILERQLSAVLGFADASGVFIWQFCDCRVPDSGFYGRPRCMNNKGVVDEYRRRKLAYDTVKRKFTC